MSKDQPNNTNQSQQPPNNPPQRDGFTKGNTFPTYQAPPPPPPPPAAPEKK